MTDWQDDEAFPGYERTRLAGGGTDSFATLLRHRSAAPEQTAILWLHGYADYFYQASVGEAFAAQGLAFHALDLRGFGRSIASSPVPNYTADLRDYWDDVGEAVAAITRAGHERLILAGHSTGGLVLADWLTARPEPGVEVLGLLLNSPFLAPPFPDLPGRPMTRVLRGFARRRPLAVIPRNPSGEYGRALHVDTGGEWAYDLDLKPHSSFPVRAGWLAAVLDAQGRIATAPPLDVPVLGLVAVRRDPSRPSSYGNGGDVVLGVRPMRAAIANLSNSVRIEAIEGAIHDVFSSRPEAREHATRVVLDWMHGVASASSGGPASDQQDHQRDDTDHDDHGA